MGLCLKKNHLLRCWGCLSLLNWIGGLTLFVAKITSKKVGALIYSMKSFSREVALYLCKSTTWPYMRQCCLVWAGAHSRYLEMLDKLQKRICSTFGPSLAASLEPLAHQ